MDRQRWVRAALVVTPLVAALLYVALNWFRIDYETTRVGATGEAARDRFLAYSRFLDRMGAKVIRVASPTGIAAPPARATLVLGTRRLSYMVPTRVQKLVSWAEHGGRLVVQAEPPGIDDPLLDALGIVRAREAPRRPDGRMLWQPEPIVSAPWPGAARELHLQFLAPPQDLKDERGRTPLASIVDRGRTVALSVPVGEGSVTVLPTLEFLNNANIGRLDHAELGWLALGPPSAAAPVLLFLHMDTAPLSEWILREAWTVAAAAALLVALWLARIIPRFGPLAPEAPPVRRSLAEHVIASGRFLWSRGEDRYLANAMRERVMRAASRRGVAAGAGAAESIARLTQLRESEIRAALNGPTARPEQIVAAAAALLRIEARLDKRSPHPSPSQEDRT